MKNLIKGQITSDKFYGKAERVHKVDMVGR